MSPFVPKPNHLQPIRGNVIRIPREIAGLKPIKIISRDEDGDTASVCASDKSLYFLVLCETSSAYVRYLCFRTRSADLEALYNSQISVRDFIKKGNKFLFFDLEKRTQNIYVCKEVIFQQIPECYLPEPQFYLGKDD